MKWVFFHFDDLQCWLTVETTCFVDRGERRNEWIVVEAHLECWQHQKCNPSPKVWKKDAALLKEKTSTIFSSTFWIGHFNILLTIYWGKCEKKSRNDMEKTITRVSFWIHKFVAVPTFIPSPLLIYGWQSKKSNQRDVCLDLTFAVGVLLQLSTSTEFLRVVSSILLLLPLQKSKRSSCLFQQKRNKLP